MKNFFLVCCALCNFYIFAIDSGYPTLDEFLNGKKVVITEGYTSDDEKEQFNVALRGYPNKIKKIAEIGLNAGHSAENFFQTCAELEHFVSFDIGIHNYVPIAVEYLSSKYKNRFTFIKGDSLFTVPKFAKNNPDEKFDLIFIDGGHEFKYCLKDILHCKKIAHKNTIIWIDNLFCESVKKAVEQCISNNIIKVIGSHIASFGSYEDCWIEAVYIFP